MSASAPTSSRAARSPAHPTTSVLALLARAHRGFDGVTEIVDEMTPLADAIERALGPHGFLDGKREDWMAATDLRSAVALGLRVPDDAPRFAGVRWSDTPDPFTPLFGVWATGYLVGAMDETGTTLLVLAPPT